MADAYPWGNQAPSARLQKLQRDLTGNTDKKTAYLETHRAKIAEFDEADKKLKADIRACEQVIEKEKKEAEGEQLSKLVLKLAGSGKVDLGSLLADPALLEQKLTELASQAAGSKKSAKKASAAAAEKAPAAEAEA